MVRVALVGVGNASSAFVQSLELFNNKHDIYGMHKFLEEPIEIVAAFDIDKRKVGKPLKEAIFSPPNVVAKYTEVRNDLIVLRGPTLDGREGILSDIIDESDDQPVSVRDELIRTKAEVVVSLLPTGTDKASRFYAEESLEAGAAFINTTPSAVAKELGQKFYQSKIPIFGDDLLSQIGGTAAHVGIISFLRERGVKVVRSYQVDIAGTTEATISLEGWRKELKKGLKSNLIATVSDGAEVTAGTSDYVGFLGDRRVSYMVIEGIYSFGVPVRVDVSMKTYDGPNAVVPLLELVQLAKIFLGERKGGPLKEVCSLYFKSPPEQDSLSLEERRRRLEDLMMKRTPVR
jgi:myo-inositol-1-phosphate synthase